MNLKDLLVKNKLAIVLVFFFFILISIWYLDTQSSIEPFVSDILTEEINKALKTILRCQKENCEAEENLVRDFTEFKKKLLLPNFSVLIFNDLLNKMKEKKDVLTKEEIEKIIESSDNLK